MQHGQCNMQFAHIHVIAMYQELQKFYYSFLIHSRIRSKPTFSLYVPKTKWSLVIKNFPRGWNACIEIGINFQIL